ncbi:methyltransferase domain-containing protein [Plectonema radiosum NIES-515]|uniref:Methyltransferase domain-containing protein n=1 Tax=Plectonema radiosum NIES-515 TaxID=2986073 RepID=A0ABT3B101_9CYAN|nr:methyltransferase domain-containing protein [Plectonema radiosum]MCV3215031.1 methyltransferase domain-containing protein [Plectonema radiosum NIES-515]
MILDARVSSFSEEKAVAAEKVLLDRFETYYTAIALWFFSGVLSDFTPNKILDVGCGTGHLLNFCSQKLSDPTASFYGVDLDEYLIKNAVSRFPDFHIQMADASQLPYPSDTFDLVYVSTVLAHVPNSLDILKEMVRVTKPGGKVAVMDQDFETAVLYPGEKQLTRKVLNAAADYWSDGWIGRKLPSMFKKLGLTNIQVDASVRIDRNFDRSFFERIRNWIVAEGFPVDQADAWLEFLTNQVKEDEFLFTRNFYAVTGIK